MTSGNGSGATDRDGVVDVTILGAGPSGLAAAYYAGHGGGCGSGCGH